MEKSDIEKPTFSEPLNPSVDAVDGEVFWRGRERNSLIRSIYLFVNIVFCFYNTFVYFPVNLLNNSQNSSSNS